MLCLRGISSGYGKKPVLHNVSFSLGAGEVVALIGPNGAGKSTVLKTVSGLLPAWDGTIEWEGVPMKGVSPARRRSMGICLVPQGRCVFPELTVEENLSIGGFGLKRAQLSQRIAEAILPFPVLQNRMQSRAGVLSGGEQQQLSFARAMVGRPKLLMCDEPSLGLAPNLVAKTLAGLAEIAAERKLSVLVVEQNVREVLKICQRVVALKLGKVVLDVAQSDFVEDRQKQREVFL